jgi:ribosomal protein L37AE/L43A
MENVKICPRCSSPEVSGKGFRKLKAGKVRVFKCKKCGRKFTPRAHDKIPGHPAAMGSLPSSVNESGSGQTP